MATDNGERVLDDLIALGYFIDMTDDGKITATKDGQTLYGKAEHGAVEWADRSKVYAVTEQAYIARLRRRIGAAGG
jgi:hypothetical protein